jgi:hypothetical protein
MESNKENDMPKHQATKTILTSKAFSGTAAPIASRSA